MPADRLAQPETRIVDRHRLGERRVRIALKAAQGNEN